MMRDSKLKPPRLIVQPPVLDFGTVRPGTGSERRITIGHAEESRVAGRLYLEEARTGLRLSATRFDSTPATLMVTLDSTGYAGSAWRETGIRIQLDDGEMHLPVRFRVRAFPPALRRGFLAAAILLLGMALWWVGGQRIAEWAWSNLGLPRLIATLPWLAEGTLKSPSLSKVEADRGARRVETQPQVQPSPPMPGVSQQPPAKSPSPSLPPLSEPKPVTAPPPVPGPPPVQTKPVQPSPPKPGESQPPSAKSPAPSPPPLSEPKPVTAPPPVPGPPPVQTNPVQPSPPKPGERQPPSAKSPAPSPPPLSEPKPVTAPPPVPGPPPVQTKPEQKPDILETVRRLRDQGKLSEALRTANEALGANPGTTEIKNIREELRGRIHEEQLGPSERQRTQKALTLLGFYTKRVDGDFGPNTRSAIRQFQQSQRAPETGWLTDDQWDILMNQVKPLLRDSEKRPRPLDPLPQGAAQRQPSNRAALPAGQVECVGPSGTSVVDAVSCQRAGGQPKR